MITSYKDLIVWQRAIELVVALYELTNRYPKTELYGLISQSQRAGVSIASNIAEGRGRGTRKDFRQFLIIAYGSGCELETQIEITKKLPFGKKLDYTKVDTLLDETMRMLNTMIQKLNQTASAT